MILLSAGTAGFTQERDATFPNLVIIFIDDMGYGDLSCYGNTQLQTPNLDSLAQQSRSFTQFYVNAPICSPSRVALMTGQYPMRWRIHSYLNDRQDNAKRGMADYLDPAATTLAEVLQSNGYATGHFGKWHMGGGRDVDDAPLPTAYGFDQSLVSFEGLGDRVLHTNHRLSEMSARLNQGHILWKPKYKTTEVYIDSALTFVDRHRDQPFYVNLWPNDVHDPHLPMPGVAAKYSGVTNNPYEQDFFAVLETLDEQIGRFLFSLDTMQILENTILIVTSDNGPTDWPRYYQEGYDPPGSTAGLKGRKWSLYEGGIRMPFFVYWKDRVTPGVDDQTVVSAIDLLPSIAHLLHIPLPDSLSLDGHDRSEAFLGRPQPHEDAICWEYASNIGGSIMPGKESHRSPTLAIRRGYWKLLINTDSTQAALYNLARDPREEHNLINEEAEQGQALAREVLHWRRSMPVEMIHTASK